MCCGTHNLKKNVLRILTQFVINWLRITSPKINFFMLSLLMMIHYELKFDGILISRFSRLRNREIFMQIKYTTSSKVIYVFLYLQIFSKQRQQPLRRVQSSLIPWSYHPWKKSLSNNFLVLMDRIRLQPRNLKS